MKSYGLVYIGSLFGFIIIYKLPIKESRIAVLIHSLFSIFFSLSSFDYFIYNKLGNLVFVKRNFVFMAYILQLFTGNYRFQNLIVMNLLPIPITTQYLRINPIEFGLGSADRCLRAEVYGYPPGDTWFWMYRNMFIKMERGIDLFFSIS